MRLTVMTLRPVARASERMPQCVTPAGVLSNVVMTTCSTWTSVTVCGVPGGGSSSNPSTRARVTRVRHFPTGCRPQARAAGDRLVVLAGGAAEHYTRKTRQLRCSARPPSHRLEVLLLSFSEHDGGTLAVTQ